MSNIHQRETWRMAGVAIAVLLLLTFILYQQTIRYLLGLWDYAEVGNYTHGYLVLVISAYLVFYNRERLALLTPCPEYRALVAIVFASMIWLTAALVDVEMLKTVGLLLLLPSLVWLLLGTEALRILAFPLLFISFAIPVWFPLSPVLQALTADAVFWLVRILEIPALRIENVIVVPAGRLSIEEYCGGLNFFLAAMTLSTLYAYLNYRTLRSRLTVILVTATAAVLVNILRVFILVYLGYATEMQHPLIEDHLSFGWYLFAGLVVTLLIVDALLHRAMRVQCSDEQPHEAKASSGTCSKTRLQFVAISLAAALLVSMGPLTIYWLDKQAQQSGPVAESSPAIIPGFGGWSTVVAVEDDWVPQYQGAIAQKVIFSNNAGQRVHLYIGLYQTQKQGEELIGDLNKISDNKIWSTKYQRAQQVEVDGRRVLEQLLQKDGGKQRLVWYWYHVAGQDTVNKYQAKALQVLGLLNGLQQASVIAIAAELDDEPEKTREVLGRFAADMGPSLTRVVDGI